mmetsp:Transcript_9143/g.25514  ORF Transcript_9143/g.25514 Transcript_9143/m.25514 type:complete len:236 (-) Transcript_9143:266-973(-)
MDVALEQVRKAALQECEQRFATRLEQLDAREQAVIQREKLVLERERELNLVPSKSCGTPTSKDVKSLATDANVFGSASVKSKTLFSKADSSDQEKQTSEEGVRAHLARKLEGEDAQDAQKPPATKSSLFGTPGPSLMAENQRAPSMGETGDQVKLDVDASDPGSASKLRAQFEERNRKTPAVRQKSWAPSMTRTSNPDGTTISTQARDGSGGGMFRSRTSFAKAPPEKKSFADLP